MLQKPERRLNSTTNGQGAVLEEGELVRARGQIVPLGSFFGITFGGRDTLGLKVPSGRLFHYWHTFVMTSQRVPVITIASDIPNQP